MLETLRQYAPTESLANAQMNQGNNGEISSGEVGATQQGETNEKLTLAEQLGEPPLLESVEVSAKDASSYERFVSDLPQIHWGVWVAIATLAAAWVGRWIYRLICYYRWRGQTANRFAPIEPVATALKGSDSNKEKESAVDIPTDQLDPGKLGEGYAALKTGMTPAINKLEAVPSDSELESLASPVKIKQLSNLIAELEIEKQQWQSDRLVYEFTVQRLLKEKTELTQVCKKLRERRALNSESDTEQLRAELQTALATKDKLKSKLKQTLASLESLGAAQNAKASETVSFESEKPTKVTV